MGRGYENLFAASESYDQDGRHATPFKILRNQLTDFHETLYVTSGTRANHSLFK